MTAFKQNAPENKLRGALPKVGIRPAIDGWPPQGRPRRSGGSNHGHGQGGGKVDRNRIAPSCGLPVECVIADHTIGGVAEAAECE